MKILKLVLTLVLSASLFGCSSSQGTTTTTTTTTETTAESSEVVYKAGTYSKTVTGRNASITVETTFSDTAITAINIVDSGETEAVAGKAMEQLPQMIIDAQSTKVDSFTGATITSAAIKSAVNQAIEEAGGDYKSMPEAYVASDEAFNETADVVVVGGGGAGMAAAVAALKEGASVILVEKTSMLGGNTVLCGGAMNAADSEWAAGFASADGENAQLEAITSLDESSIPSEYLEDYHTLQQQVSEYLAGDTSAHFDSVELHTIQTYYHGLRTDLNGETIYGEYDLVTTMTKNAMDTVNWLGELGIQWQDVVTQPVGAMWRRGHNPSMRQGTEYVAVLGELITKLGGTIYYQTAAEELIVDENNKVIGINATMSNGATLTVNANKAVILACGGYGNNLSMVQETNTYWEEIPDDTGTTNASGQTGDGIMMATAIGAGTTGMGFAQFMPVSDPVTGDLFTGLIPQVAANYIFVNGNGNRFVNETSARDTLTQAAIANGGTFYMIADADIAEEARWLTDWEVEVERGNAIMADSLEELAEKLGFDETQTQNFLQAMADYNAHVESGEEDEFGKTNYDKGIYTAPFYATPRKPAIHHTMGGLTIDTGAHVLDTEGNIIAGLYAAGEVTGGIHGGNRLGGNAVADCMTFGKIAGTNAANE